MLSVKKGSSICHFPKSFGVIRSEPQTQTYFMQRDNLKSGNFEINWCLSNDQCDHYSNYRPSLISIRDKSPTSHPSSELQKWLPSKVLSKLPWSQKVGVQLVFFCKWNVSQSFLDPKWWWFLPRWIWWWFWQWGWWFDARDWSGNQKTFLITKRPSFPLGLIDLIQPYAYIS